MTVTLRDMSPPFCSWVLIKGIINELLLYGLLLGWRLRIDHCGKVLCKAPPRVWAYLTETLDSKSASLRMLLLAFRRGSSVASVGTEMNKECVTVSVYVSLYGMKCCLSILWLKASFMNNNATPFPRAEFQTYWRQIGDCVMGFTTSNSFFWMRSVVIYAHWLCR
jgi:hypothetical protein